MIRVDKSKCAGCGKCADVCPTQAIYLAGKEVFVREGLCRACGACVEACPKGAITMMTPFLSPYPPKGIFRPFHGISFGAGHPIKRGGRHRFGRRGR